MKRREKRARPSQDPNRDNDKKFHLQKGIFASQTTMKYVDEYRDIEKCRALAALINKEAEKGARAYRIMEVCGSHTASIHRFGIRKMLSPKIRLVSGPGCPVCVTSDGYLKNVIRILRRKNILLATYPDMLRVPIAGTSLEAERSKGSVIRSVASALDVLELSRRNMAREVVFLGIGFETTAPATALAIKTAQREKLKNLSVYSSHKTTPEVLMAMAGDKELDLDGFILPGHVSTIIGLAGYRPAMAKFNLPSVISGFEPVDLLLSIYKIVAAVRGGEAVLENEYGRIVRENGNVRAKALLKEVFMQGPGYWRGLGLIKDSELHIRKEFKAFDAFAKFGLKKEALSDTLKVSCRCADVVKGKIAPPACPYFGKTCTPQSPQGPCMVGREGSCRSYFEYR